jgi:hypothetical protein
VVWEKLDCSQYWGTPWSSGWEKGAFFTRSLTH